LFFSSHWVTKKFTLKEFLDRSRTVDMQIHPCLEFASPIQKIFIANENFLEQK